MLLITFANRLETLRATLLGAIAQAPAQPFIADQVIVPSSALRRDLTLAIAERFGICANVEFSYLAQWIWCQIGKVLPTIATDSPFASPVLTWRIYELLGNATFTAEFPRLHGYLRQTDAVARFDFSSKVAALFEQYMTYRADWLATWVAGQDLVLERAAEMPDQAWQAALWRAIMTQLDMQRDGPQEHPASAFLRRVESLGDEAVQHFGLARVAHIFCLPTIPPLYLDLLRQLGRWLDLRLYVLNPCREYWFEIVDRRRLSYLAVRGDATYHESGNRLLAAWGKQTQAHIDLLLETATEALVDDGGFLPATQDTMLARVQNAILDLTEIGPGSAPPSPGDRSIEIHVCHSLTRELEVLQDQLLALFADSSVSGMNPLRPGDILVVTPELEAAAPLVDAVFGNAPQERRIPFAVTGRARSTINAPARALLALLDLVASRFPASAVFDMLQQPIVARRFAIAPDDLDCIQSWVRESGIRWGIDAQHRRQQGLPSLDRFSFDDGLQRLFLGYALPSEVTSPWHERLPAGNAEGSAALALGLFEHFFSKLTLLRADFLEAKPPGAWMQKLHEAMDDFLEADAIDDIGEVRAAIRELGGNMTQGGITSAIPLEVVRTALETLLDDPARGGVATGMVTFSSISSLRNLPFRVVCGIGLNDGAFPGASRPVEFDLMAIAPRRGDRQRRVDERNLFLDLILAARERLYLSYTGRSIRDNAPLPGSVLVSELIETLLPVIATDPTCVASRAEARRRLVVEHPLQPFSPRYFSADTDAGADPRMRSFNRELCEALRLAHTTEIPVSRRSEGVEDEEGSEVVAPFFKQRLAAPGAEWRVVSLDRLIRFFRNPSRFLLRERLGIELVEAGDELADEEPFLPDFPGRQAMAERLLPHYSAGMADADLHRLAVAGVEYPQGTFGDLLLDQELLRLRTFAENVDLSTSAPCLAPVDGRLDFDLEGETWRETWLLNGAFADLRADGLVRQRYDDTRATDYLEGWLTHLFVCAIRPDGVVLETRWLSRDGEYRLLPCHEAGAILRTLLHLYRRGLCEPLHFFPKSAWKYLEGGENLARSTWYSSRGRPWGEEENPAHRLALRGCDQPIDADFVACAEAVFGSMRPYLDDSRL